MKNLQVNLKLLIVILFFIISFSSCNNEDLFVLEETALVVDEPVDQGSNEDTDETSPGTTENAPQIEANDDNVTTNENIPIELLLYTNDVNIPESITVTHTDPISGSLNLSDNNTPQDLSDDMIIYTPNSGFSGIDSFDYTICDAANASNCSSATVIITVNQNQDNFATELKAFPNAIGAGAYATGGRGGTVCHVNTLTYDAPAVYDATTDTYSGGFETLMLLDIPAKQIVFDVAGTIVLPDYSEWKWTTLTNKGNITVSGQTAPGKVVISTDYFKLFDCKNIIFRYLSWYSRGTHNADVMWIASSTGLVTDDIIVDHCSFYYGGDECLSIASSTGDGVINNITIQNTLMAASSKGSILGSYEGETDATMARCAFVDVNYRFPNPVTNGNGQIDMINIFVENVGNRIVRTSGGGNFNVQNFYCQTNRIDYGRHRVQYLEANPPLIHSSGMILTNVKDTPTSPDFDMWSIFAASDLPTYIPLPESIKEDTPMALVGKSFTIYQANEVKGAILPVVGNNKRLDADGGVINDSYELDTFYIDLGLNQVSTTEYIRYNSTVYPDPISGTAYTDSDKDGMPDTWETATFGNLTRNGTGDLDVDGYTDLEEFLNRVDL